MALASPQRLRLQIIIALDNGEGQVTDLRKFLHITRPEETVSTLTSEVDEKFKKLYPAERPITILSVQDDSRCDLDPAFQLLDVFEERGVARIIISDDGEGVRRFHSPASQVRHLQRNEHPRRESFDSVTGYVTPSVSSLNTGSPIQSRPAGHRPPALAIDVIGESATPLTEDALEKMQIEQTSHSPQILSPSPMPPSERKRKRSDEMEIPGTPQAKGSRPVKKRATAKSRDVPEITDSQDTKILETPEINKRRKASPPKEVEPPQKSRNTRARKSKLQDKDLDEKKTTDKEEHEVVTEKVRDILEPKVVTTKNPPTRKQTAKQIAAVKGQARSELVSPLVIPPPDPEPTTKTRGRAKKNIAGPAADSAPISEPEPIITTAKKSLKLTEEKDVSKHNSPPKPNPWSAERKTKAKQPPKRTTAKVSKETLIPEPESMSKAISAKRKAAKSKSPEVSSATSDFPSSKGSVEEEEGTSLTSQSESEASSSDSEAESDLKTTKNKEDSASDSDEESSNSDSSSEESDSEDKMDVDSVKDKGVFIRGSPAASGRRSLSPLKKGKATSKSTTKVSEAEDKDVSRSPSPSASASLSKSDKSSDSDSSDAEDSASSDASVDNHSDSERSVLHHSDDISNSDSESSDSDSSSSSKSSASSSSSKRRAASPAASASSTKSSAKDGNSSSSSQLVAQSLGGQTSAKKSQPVDPILHRTYLSQATDRSPNNTTLSQQSPLAKHGQSMLKRWTSLSDMAANMKNKPTKTVIAKAKGKEEDASDESGSDSDSSQDSSSDDEKEVGNGIPKAKLAGRAPVAKKKSGGLRALFK